MAYTTIDDPSAYFQTVLWSGDSSSPRTITFDGNSDLQPNWIWTKKRDGADHHQLYDSVRTFGAGKDLCSGQTFDEGNAANASTALGFVSSATSDGFVVTAGNHATASIRTLLQNITGKTYVGWGWKAGTSFTNDASATGIGTIDSSGSVSTDAGFSICSWVGTGSNGTIKHGLSTVPEMMIIKNTGHDTNWSVYTKPTGELGELRLNNTDAFTDDATLYNDTAPTSSVFSVGTNYNTNHSDGRTYIGYIFSSVKGYSKFGSYTGNGNADGTFVYTGFKPAFVIYKRYDSSGYSWVLVDNKRNTFNPVDKYLHPDLTATEGTVTLMDFTSTGFKMRVNDTTSNQGSIFYMAFAENPFVTSTGIPTTAR